MTVTPPPGGLGHTPKGTGGASVPRWTGPLVVGTTESDVVEAIKKRMREAVSIDGEKYGVDCPLCDQLVKLYRRPMSAKSCILLVLLYVEYGATESFHLWQDGHELWGRRPAYPSDTHMLLWWRMLDTITEDYDKATGEEITAATKPADMDVREVPGVYTVSLYAEKWIRGEILVPAQVRVYNHKPFGKPLVDVGVDIYQGTGHKFVLDDLLEESDSDVRRTMIYRAPKVKRPRRARGWFR